MVIKSCRNMAKALELRLEQNKGSKYSVVLSGMTVYMRTRCLSGVCEGMTGDITELENETFSCLSFEELSTAEETYSNMKDSLIVI